MKAGGLTLSRVAVLLFFLGLLVTGLFAFDDYGVSWDEQANRSNGAISAIYVNEKFHHALLSEDEIHAKLTGIRRDADRYLPDAQKAARIPYTARTLLTPGVDRSYGVFFELILIAVEALVGLSDSRSVYLMRHVCTFLLFYMSVVVFYRLTTRRFGHWTLGLIGCTVLILSPVIFAHAFYNSKDLALLSMWIFATYSLLKLLDQWSIRHAVVHAFTSAAAIDIRVAGLALPAITLSLFAVHLLTSPGRKAMLKQCVPGLLVYVALLPGLVMLFWPYLWEQPVAHFREAVATLSKVSWWDQQVFYLGTFFNATEVPRHYLPVWILISTPISYSCCFLLGALSFLAALLRNGLHSLYSDPHKRYDLVNVLLFFVPLCTMIVLKIGFFDGWRHAFFVYPAFVSIALLGLLAVVKPLTGAVHRMWRVPQAILLAGLLADLLHVGYFMIHNHPHQHVYLNVLAGKDPRRTFELDYWGLSYRQGLEYLLRYDSSSVVKVNVANLPGELNARILKPEQRHRLRFVPLNEATYFLSNFRSHPQDYEVGREWHAVTVDGMKILAVYKLR